MPWFPDFVGAVELSRRQTRAAGLADPVMEYLTALNDGDSALLETVWPGEVVVYDPRAGEIRGHRRLERFVRDNRSWLAEHHARVEHIASTRADGRAVVELLAHLDGDEWGQGWPVAVVAESPNDMSVIFRTYCSQWPVDGHRHVRPPVLAATAAQPADIVGRYQTALAAGDTDAIVGTFTADGYYRDTIGAHPTHRGAAELRSFFSGRFDDGGGIVLQNCELTDDGVRCVIEYNLTRWGDRDLPAQAGLAVYERAPDGLLAAARVYDDVQPPAANATEEP